jgi:hypothetical protein
MKRFGKFLLIYGALMAFLLYSLPTCEFQSKARLVVAASNAPLEPGNNVKFKYQIVGKITGVEAFNDSLLISYKLQRKFKVPDNYIATVYLNAFGNNYLELSEATSNFKRKDTLRAVIMKTPGFDSLQKKNLNETIQMIADMLKQHVDSTQK